MTAEPPPPSDPPVQIPPPAPVAAPVRPRVRFGDLAGEAAEVEVEHAGQIYRLRRTRAGKLLLTK